MNLKLNTIGVFSSNTYIEECIQSVVHIEELPDCTNEVQVLHDGQF